MRIIKHAIHFFDRLEDRIRSRLSRRPILYTLIGGFAVVLFWRGVWITADMIPFLNGPLSIVISVFVLLVTGLFVSFFIGDRVIITGLRGEKKLVEKTESEIESEAETLKEIKKKIEEMDEEIHELKK